MAKKIKPRASVRRHSSGTMLAHIDTRDGALVALGNLRVLITKEDGSWVAQGLEIDYAAYGPTIPEVRERFECGLAMTIDAHLRVHKSLDHLIGEVAPPEVWRDYLADHHRLHRFTHSQVSIYQIQKRLPFGGAAAELPYENIDYYEQKTA